MDASGFNFIKMKIGLSIVTVKVLCSVEKCLIWSHVSKFWDKTQGVSCVWKVCIFFKNCTSNYICGKCDGKHISWFSKLKKDQERDESSSDNVGVHVVVLKGTYQAAKGKVAGISRDRTWMTMQILFEAECQRTYLTESFHKYWKLETVRTENVFINTSGTLHKSKLANRDVVQLKIKHIFLLRHCVIQFLQTFKNEEI